MSYDGFYSDLSTRGSSNEILNQIALLKEEVIVASDSAEQSAINSEDSAQNSLGYSLAANSSAQRAEIAAGAAEEAGGDISGIVEEVTALRDSTIVEADRAEAAATLSENSAQVAQVSQAEAATSAAIAEAAKDVVQSVSGVFQNTTEGLAATTGSLKYFYVPSASNDEVLIMYRNNLGVAVDTGKRTPSAALIDNVRLTSGELFSKVSTYGQALNGGVLLLDVTGRITGLRIPAGQTANSSYFRAETGLTSQISNLVGTKIQIDMYLDATPNFLTDTVMTTLVMQVLRAGNPTTVTPESQSLTQVGTVIHKIVTYTIQEGDSDVYPVFRPGVSTTGVDRTAQMTSVSWKLLSQPAGKITYSDYHLQQRLVPIIATTEDNKLTSGEKMDGNLFLWSGEALGGSVRVNDVNGNMVGLSVPSGSSGGASYISPFFKVDGANLTGATISVTSKFTATPNFIVDCPPGSATVQVRRGLGSVNVAPLNLRVSQTGAVVTKTFDYVITASDLAIAPTYQIISTTPVAAYVRSISISSMKYVLSNIPSGNTAADVLLGVQLDSAMSKIAVLGPESVVSVSNTGGDYSTIQDANAALSGASLSKPTTISIKDKGDALNIMLNDYVSISGSSQNLVEIHHELPANVDPTLIPGNQTLRPEKNHNIKNVAVTCKNMRYPIHSDSGGGFRNGKIVVEDSVIEHLGNQEAQDYQDSIGSGVTVWTSEHAWGYGASSGQKVIMRRTKLKSRTSAMYAHTNLNFSKPVEIDIEDCQFIATNEGGKAIYVQPLGSGQADTLSFRGTELVGDIYYWMNPWMPNTLEYQPANHCEIKITGSSSSPAVFDILESGRALKIQSATEGVSSSVTVGGDAVSVIFGKENYSLRGCVGIAGYVYGWADISGMNVGSPTVGNITSLGKRLGDCTTTNKTLSILIDGTLTKTIVFNLDYTSTDNATILSSINTVLDGAAVASAYNVGGLYRPKILNEELSLKNNTSVGFLKGTALAYNGSRKNIRKMTSTDPVSIFAGIAWEDIYPNTFGRVKIGGYLPQYDLLGGPFVLTFDQALYVDTSTAGTLTTVVGTTPLLRAIRSDAVTFL